MRLFVAVMSLLLAVALALPAFAQSPDSATIVVLVFDQTGAVVPGADVVVANTLTSASREAISGADGSAVAPALSAAGRYRITVKLAGFSDEVVGGVTLRAGETARIKVGLHVSGGRSSVTVYGTAEGIRQDPQIGVRFDARQIDQVPLLGRKVTAVPLLDAAFRPAKGTGDLFLNNTLFVANAGGRRQTTFEIDGAAGDDPWGRQTLFSNIPLGAVQEMNVLASAFSAEFGWTNGTAVNIVTKSGTNEPHGEALYLDRPGGLEAGTARLGGSTIVTPDIPDVLHQVSGAFGGPLVRDRTFFFVAADDTRQDRTAYFSAAVPPALLTQSSYVGRYRQALIDGRADHAFGRAQHLMLRFNLDRFSDSNPQDTVSNTTLPSAARIFTRDTMSLQANLRSVPGNNAVNEARLEWQDGDPITRFEAVAPSTQFVRPGVATEGESRVAHIRSRQAQLSDTLSWNRGRHYVTAGGSLAWATSGGDGQEFGSGFVLGQFTVKPGVTAPIDRLTTADVSRYTQSVGTGTYESSQWIYALFAQDSLRVRRDLTLDVGLRYDRQTFSDGTKNFAPRTGFAWNPGGSPRTSVRGGYGIYYSQIIQDLQANFSLNGPTGVFTYSAAPGQPGFPSSLAAVPIDVPAGVALPPRDITIRPGMPSYYAQFFDISKLKDYPSSLVNARSGVGSIGVEHEIAPRWFASADFVTEHWTGIPRPLDLNAPSLFVRTAPGQVRTAAAADATRPIAPAPNGYRRIVAIVNGGVADYNGLELGLKGHIGDRATVSLSYTLSKSTNTVEPDAPSQDPNDANQPGGPYEEAPSQLDQRHRAVLSGSYRTRGNIVVGGVAQLASARPYTATTGVDNNGDGSISDRPVVDGVVVARNTFRGTPAYDVSLFVERSFTVWASHSLLLRAEGLNVLNHANVLARNGTYGNGAAPLAAFGLPATGLANLDPARQVQLEARFAF